MRVAVQSFVKGGGGRAYLSLILPKFGRISDKPFGLSSTVCEGGDLDVFLEMWNVGTHQINIF